MRPAEHFVNHFSDAPTHMLMPLARQLTWLTCNWTGHGTTCGVNYQALLARRSLTATFHLHVTRTRTTTETTAPTVIVIPAARHRRTVTGSLPIPDLSFRTWDGRGDCLMNRSARLLNRMLHWHRTLRLRRRRLRRFRPTELRSHRRLSLRRRRTGPVPFTHARLLPMALTSLLTGRRPRRLIPLGTTSSMIGHLLARLHKMRTAPPRRMLLESIPLSRRRMTWLLGDRSRMGLLLRVRSRVGLVAWCLLFLRVLTPRMMLPTPVTMLLRGRMRMLLRSQVLHGT